MDSTKLNDWMQVVGIFAVVGSLIFVGLQKKQTQAIALSQAYQARATAAVDWTSSFAANASALTAFRKAANGQVDEITDDDYWALRYVLIGVF